MNEKTARQIAEMKNQTIGVEVEMNNIERSRAAKVAAEFFTSPQRYLLGADEAKGLADLERREGRLSVIRDALDDLEDSGEGEVELGGKRYTAGQLRKLCRQTERDVEELREAYGELRKSLSARTAKLLRLGLAAEKEATRAGKRKPAGRKARQARTAREEDPEELDDLPRRPRPERGASRREPGEGGAEDRGMSARERLRRMTMDIARGAGRRRA